MGLTYMYMYVQEYMNNRTCGAKKTNVYSCFKKVGWHFSTVEHKQFLAPQEDRCTCTIHVQCVFSCHTQNRLVLLLHPQQHDLLLDGSTPSLPCHCPRGPAPPLFLLPISPSSYHHATDSGAAPELIEGRRLYNLPVLNCWP